MFGVVKSSERRVNESLLRKYIHVARTAEARLLKKVYSSIAGGRKKGRSGK